MASRHNRLNGHDSAEFHKRFRLLLLIIVCAMSVLLVRMWHLQVIKGSELYQRSESNSMRNRTIRAIRGVILDTNRKVLVDNQAAFDILFHPQRAGNVQEVTKRFAALCTERSLPYPEEILEIRKTRSVEPLRIERNISREKLALVEAHTLELPGMVSEVVPVRQYLQGERMAHVIGYMGEISPEELGKEGLRYSSGDMVGKFGIERYLDAPLRGVNGAENVVVNVVGKEVRILGRLSPVAGHNVVLNIDSVLQEAAWKALDGRPGSVVALDPRNGAVLALLSSPSFDPNLFRGGISARDWKKLSQDPAHPLENRAISGQYPPGSTYKLVVAAAALEEGLITPSTSFNCTGSFTLGNRTFRCWQKHGHGRVSLHRAIVESCDVYFYNLGKLLGVDKIARYARAFGFGDVTGIDLPREKGGIIPTRDWKLARFKAPWQPGETISISIGQGYNTVTTLQLASAYGALANGGTLWRPRVIRQIEAIDGKVVQAFPPEKKSVLPIREENRILLRDALWGVVNEPGGTGGALRRKEADVAGKTGTAQVVGNAPDGKVKSFSGRFRDHALFVCFAPHEHPEIVVAVIAENAGHGGSAAAPVARKVIDAYFEQKNPAAKEQTARRDPPSRVKPAMAAVQPDPVRKEDP
ncbi:MAG: penicillin-binding protein 2 [Syntrophaceae bacterium]|nr:penicillin-binding protein 2 [Syntrophaceae bacterium]